MPTFDRGDIVRVPFPYADRNTAHHRPAVVVASGLGLEGMLIWVVMVTAAVNRQWPGDIAIPDHVTAGLPIPSIVRTSKAATLTARRATRLGRLPPATLAALDAQIATYLGIQPSVGGFHE